jgi:hypothetical protein
MRMREAKGCSFLGFLLPHARVELERGWCVDRRPFPDLCPNPFNSRVRTSGREFSGSKRRLNLSWTG